MAFSFAYGELMTKACSESKPGTCSFVFHRKSNHPRS